MHEPIHGDLLIVNGQALNRQPQIVQVIEVRCHFSRLLQADLVLARRAGHPLNALQHGVQDRPCEVCLGVRQLRLVVRARRLAQGKISLAFQVTDQDRPLPCWSVLQEVSGKDRD